MRAAIARGFPPTARPGARARFGVLFAFFRKFFRAENFPAVCAQSPAPSCKRPISRPQREGGIVFPALRRRPGGHGASQDAQRARGKPGSCGRVSRPALCPFTLGAVQLRALGAADMRPRASVSGDDFCTRTESV